jgi:hypothetical protein
MFSLFLFVDRISDDVCLAYIFAVVLSAPPSERRVTIDDDKDILPMLYGIDCSTDPPVITRATWDRVERIMVVENALATAIALLSLGSSD